MERTVLPRRFRCKRGAFILKSPHTSIGVHNEYFLYHRRSGSYRPCSRLPWSARLISNGKARLTAAIATSGTAIPKPTGSCVGNRHGSVVKMVTRSDAGQGDHQPPFLAFNSIPARLKMELTCDISGIEGDELA